MKTLTEEEKNLVKQYIKISYSEKEYELFSNDDEMLLIIFDSFGFARWALTKSISAVGKEVSKIIPDHILNFTKKVEMNHAIFTVGGHIVIEQNTPSPAIAMIRKIVDTQEKEVRAKLIELGWTPPETTRKCATCRFLEGRVCLEKVATDTYGEFIEYEDTFYCSLWEEKQ